MKGPVEEMTQPVFLIPWVLFRYSPLVVLPPPLSRRQSHPPGQTREEQSSVHECLFTSDVAHPNLTRNPKGLHDLSITGSKTTEASGTSVWFGVRMGDHCQTNRHTNSCDWALHKCRTILHIGLYNYSRSDDADEWISPHIISDFSKYCMVCPLQCLQKRQSVEIRSFPKPQLVNCWCLCVSWIALAAKRWTLSWPSSVSDLCFIAVNHV